jgi:hypothetical protein
MEFNKWIEWKMENKDLLFFHKMWCYGMCGIVKLINIMKHYKTLRNMYNNDANEKIDYTQHIIHNQVCIKSNIPFDSFVWHASK